MNLHISKSKNAESFYIAKSYVKSNGTTSSTIVRKLGTLNQRAKNTDQIQSFRWGVFMDGDGIPLAFSLFPGNTNEQKSLKPLEQKLIGGFWLSEIYLLQ